MNLKFMKLWYVSLVLYGVGLVAFALGFFNSFTDSVIYLFAFIVPATIFYLISIKKLTFKEGYSLPQAIQFYKKCSKIGINNRATMLDQFDKASKFASELGFSKKANEGVLYTMFRRGEMYTRSKTLP